MCFAYTGATVTGRSRISAQGSRNKEAHSFGPEDEDDDNEEDGTAVESAEDVAAKAAALAGGLCAPSTRRFFGSGAVASAAPTAAAAVADLGRGADSTAVAPVDEAESRTLFVLAELLPSVPVDGPSKLRNSPPSLAASAALTDVTADWLFP